MTDYVPCFTDVDDDWRRRWTLLREFLRSWYSMFEYSATSRQTYQISGEFPAGIHPVETWGQPVADVEKRLGVTLPPSLREWHSLFHQTNSHYFNLLRDDHSMLWSDGGKLLVFRVLCEGNIAWGVRKSDLDDDDPFVYEMDVKVHGEESDSWRGTEWTISQSTRHRVSEWLIRNIIWYLSNRTSINVRFPDASPARERLLTEINSDCERKSMFGRYEIFESVNRWFAYDRATESEQLVPVYFADDVDFDRLPDWIVSHTNDHRVT